MTTLNLTIITATPQLIEAEALTDAEGGVNRRALRRLIMTMAGNEMGLKLTDLIRAGYDGELVEGWTYDLGTIPGGRRRMRYAVRPMTEEEQTARLSYEGGFMKHSDGSMGFALPAPRGPVQRPVVKQRKPHKAPEAQSKPAPIGDPARMDRPRLR